MDWAALASAFALVFVAELGDKTQLAVITQMCRVRRPWAVFLGASLALVAVTLIGALGGQTLGKLLPPSVLRLIASVGFAVVGVLIAREAIKTGRREAENTCRYEPSEGGDCAMFPSAWDWKAFASTFGLLFVAELGDKTQLAVLSLAGRSRAPWSVFLGSSLALTSVTALGVVGGQGLRKLIPERVLLWISSVAFGLMGVLMGLGVL